MLSIKKIKNINLYNLFILVFLISSCSSMNVTEEVVYDGGIRTVEASMQEDTELDYETKAIFTNATVYFEFDKFNLNSKSLQTLKSAVLAMKDNQSIRITIAGHADERGTREYNLALGQRRAEGEITFTTPASMLTSIPSPPNSPLVSVCISSKILGDM